MINILSPNELEQWLHDLKPGDVVAVHVVGEAQGTAGALMAQGTVREHGTGQMETFLVDLEMHPAREMRFSLDMALGRVVPGLCIRPVESERGEKE